MDYSKFSDPDFDVKEWVNAAFRSQKESSTDQYATTLVMKLQMFIQEVNNVIEDSCQQAIHNLPRVMRELEAVQQEAKLLQDQMTIVKQDIEKVEKDTSQSMQMLLKIDTIKSRMKDTSDALKEADNWTTLSADVEEVFDSQDVDAIASKLLGMQQSLLMLTDVADYDDRCQYLEMLRNRLEAMLSPQLVSAFNAQSIDEAKKFVKIFSDIDRKQQLYKYYHKTQRGKLLQKWRDIQDESGDTIVEWMNELYDHLLTEWHAQIKWCGQLFDEPAVLVCELFADTLNGLDPSMASCIELHLQVQEDCLPVLIELKQISERFAKSLEGAIHSSISSNIDDKYEEELAKAIYAPYCRYIETYDQMEDDKLTQALEAIKLDHSEVLDCVRLLNESVSKLFTAANQASERCTQFSNGSAFVGLIRALKKYFSDYCSEFRRVLTNLGERCQSERMDMDSEDWTWFQHSLRIIQICGDLILHVEELDQALVVGIVSTAGKYIQSSPMSPLKDTITSPRLEGSKKKFFEDFSTLLLENPDDRLALQDLYMCLEEGSDPSVLGNAKVDICKLSEAAHKFAFNIVFAPLSDEVRTLASMEIWTSESAGGALTTDLPDFSLSPQEYITKIGQYLLTLPQQLEPFTLQEQPSIAVALKYGKLPHTTQQDFDDALADLWLESVARATMHSYNEEILKIPNITSASVRQLVMDIEYFSNVLDDLGLPTSDSMTDLVTLLKTTPEDYSSASHSMPLHLTNAVAKMRNIALA